MCFIILYFLEASNQTSLDFYSTSSQDQDASSEVSSEISSILTNEEFVDHTVGQNKKIWELPVDPSKI